MSNNNHHQLPLSVQPIISYPREAEVGKTYLMTIDLQTSGDDWPYQEEEYPIYCMLETSPLFSSKPVGEPAVILHRFGGTYGAAQFLLTAAQEELEGEIKVTLVNGWGVPIRALKLTEIKLKLMDVKPPLTFLEYGVFATTERYLNDTQAIVTQGSWEGKTYGESVNEQQIDHFDRPSVIPQEFLESIARKQGVSGKGLKVLFLAINGQTTSGIADALKISEPTVRKHLSIVYEKFHISARGPGRLTQLRQLLVSQYQTQQQQQTGNTSPVAPVLNTPHQDWGNAPDVSSLNYLVNFKSETPHRDWGNAPDVSVFFGRSEELTTLENWIVNDRCRLIALVGGEGIGKTALSVKLAKRIENNFDYVIWHSLFYALPLNDLLATLIKFISHGQQLSLPDNLDERISELLKYLKAYRCLLILDNLDPIFSSKEVFAAYQEKYKDYGKLLTILGQEEHQSCLLINSVVKPREIGFQEGVTLPVRSWQMTGLKEEDARNILESKDLSDENKWRTITNIFRGNPLALKIVSANIRVFCSGSISKFYMFSHNYNERVAGYSWTEELMDMQFQGLSSLEKEIATWLAIEGEPVELQDLQRYISLLVPEPKIFEFFEEAFEEAIESLKRLALLEKVQRRFTLHPVVIKYLKNQLLDQIFNEISIALKSSKAEEFRLLKRYCLIKAHEKVCKTGDKKLSPIVQIKERLYNLVKDKNRLTEHLEGVLLKLQNTSPLEVGYAVDNLQALLSVSVEDLIK